MASVLLGVIPVVIIQKNGRCLVNQAVTAELRQSVAQQLMDGTEMARSTYLPQECIGPRKLNLVAAVDLGGDRIESEVAVRCTPSSCALKATKG